MAHSSCNKRPCSASGVCSFLCDWYVSVSVFVDFIHKSRVSSLLGNMNLSASSLPTDQQELQSLQPFLRLVLFQLSLVKIIREFPWLWTHSHDFYHGVCLVSSYIAYTLIVASWQLLLLLSPLDLNYFILWCPGVRH